MGGGRRDYGKRIQQQRTETVTAATTTDTVTTTTRQQRITARLQRRIRQLQNSKNRRTTANVVLVVLCGPIKVVVYYSFLAGITPQSVGSKVCCRFNACLTDRIVPPAGAL